MREWLLALAIVIVPTAQLKGAIVTQDFKCGSKVAGSLRVEYSDNVEAYDGPYVCDDGSYTIRAGMTIEATVTPKPCPNGIWDHFAWMQAIVDYEAPAVFADKAKNILADPWPDTTPGGYWVSSICGGDLTSQQVFDNEPWYGNNKIGDLTLYDQPKNGVTTDPCGFETWLVCVTGKVGSTYNVIPLMGFTWSFEFDYGEDGDDAGIIVGDSISEYVGSTSFAGPFQGGQPSETFKTGYAKYFNINYLANNDENCKECCVIPEPSSLAVFSVLLGIVAIGRRRQWRGPGT